MDKDDNSPTDATRQPDICPKCGSEKLWTPKHVRPWQCIDCKHTFQPAAGTRQPETPRRDNDRTPLVLQNILCEEDGVTYIRVRGLRVIHANVAANIEQDKIDYREKSERLERELSTLRDEAAQLREEVARLKRIADENAQANQVACAGWDRTKHALTAEKREHETIKQLIRDAVKATGLTEEENTTLGLVCSICDLATARCADVNQLRADNARLRDVLRAVEWRSIETAPKDGTNVLICCTKPHIGTRMVVAHYMPGGHCIEDHPPIDEGWYYNRGSMFDLFVYPTHWMPLPEPPAALGPQPEGEA